MRLSSYKLSPEDVNNKTISIYKQAILPIFDYLGFLLLSQTNGQKNELQIIQNDALRFANQVTRNDRISKVELHKKVKLLSLEQRREKQLYTLMYKLSLRGMYRKITNRNTRNQQTYV